MGGPLDCAARSRHDLANQWRVDGVFDGQMSAGPAILGSHDGTRGWPGEFANANDMISSGVRQQHGASVRNLNGCGNCTKYAADYDWASHLAKCDVGVESRSDG